MSIEVYFGLICSSRRGMVKNLSPWSQIRTEQMLTLFFLGSVGV